MDKAFLLISVFLTLACRSAATQSVVAANAAPVTGSWGGRHVGLVLDPSRGRLEYDCASGEIAGPVRLDTSGRFAASGYHQTGIGGPERVGHVPERAPASYSGRVEGDAMTLLVRIPSLGLEIGPLSLRRNEEPTIMRCL